MHERDKKIHNHPLFKKAEEVYKIVSALIENFPEEEKEMHAGILMESAMILAPKLAGAIGSDSWLISMQNAAIIRYHAQNLHTATSSMDMENESDQRYVQLLRTEMEEFRMLFKEWVKSLNALEDEDYSDEWGLFIRKK